ncbi:sigma factor-like helix-turn-helix DNA-binding protein [Kitasatospora sp. NPDC002965]|uniref:TnsA endonuclease N-terminal domain-containing protein n=1 Tax=Kitasatospora sp. NPDC002965 TaxID=3154775 RepID=UPI0033BE291F
MESKASGSRAGLAWTEAEDERLLEAAGRGQSLEDLAARHGRTVGGIRARLSRFVPLTDAGDEELLQWLRTHAGPVRAADHTAGRTAERAAERTGGRAARRTPAAPDPRAADVLAEWQHLTGHELRRDRQTAFLARPVVGTLAAADPAVRRDTGRRLWQDTRQLLLEDWALECRCPGATAPAPPWSAVAGHDDDTAMALRELLAAAVDELPRERHRRIMTLRLGVGDHEAQTLETVADAFGLSRERIRQLQQKAVSALARATTPAARRFRSLLSELGRPDGTPTDGEDGPPDAERLLDLARVLLPSVPPRRAVALLATLAGAGRLPADNLAARAMTIRTLRHGAARREAARQGRTERATVRWSRLEADVRWAGTGGSAPPRAELEALREADDEDPRSGSWECPKLGRAVAYESETELQVIQLLSFASQVAYYQEQPLAVGYEFDGRARTYFPDLLVATTDGRCVLVEVKPVFEMATAVNVAKYRALEALCRDHGWGLLVTDGYRTRSLVENHPVDPRLAEAIGPLLAEGTVLGWPHVLTAAGAQRPGSLDIAALALRHGWEWRTRPFRLSAGRAAPAPVPVAVPELAPTSTPLPVPDLVPAPVSVPGPVEAPEPDPGPAAVPGPRQETLPGQDDPAPPVPGEPVCPTPEEIEAARTPAGGWRRSQLAAWGVPWPPPKGWKQRLTARSRSGRS